MENGIGVKGSVAALALLLLVLVAVPANADNRTIGGLLEIQLLKHEPYPAEPGSYINVWFSVANSIQGVSAENVECVLEEKYPFSLDDPNTARQVIGQLKPAYDAVLKYRVRVASDAALGDNELLFKCRSTSYDWLELEATIFIQSHEAIISVESVSATPEEVAPGEKTRVKVTIKNLADSILKDVGVKLDVSGATLPFAPLGGTTERMVKSLNAGEEKTLYFDLVADADAEAGLYKIPLELSYSDELGTEYSKEDIIGLVVYASPSLDLELESTTILRANTKGEVALNVVNNGLSDVKFLRIRLKPSQYYSIISTSEYYIGELSSDDYDSVDYVIYVKEGALASTPLEFELDYADSANKKHVEAQNVSLRVYSEEEIAALGLEPSAGVNVVLLLVGLAVIAYAVYWLYKRFRKKK